MTARAAAFVLHDSFRSATPYRVRTAPDFKRIDFGYVPYRLGSGKQRSALYLAAHRQARPARPARQLDAE